MEALFEIECEAVDEFEFWLLDEQLGEMIPQIETLGPSKHGISVRLTSQDAEFLLVMRCPWPISPVD